MCDKKDCCCNPAELKGEPRDCPPDQIKKCHGDDGKHGDAGKHPCTDTRTDCGCGCEKKKD